jgi:hypothetical protein
MDIGVDVEVTDGRSPAQIVAERLARLAAGAVTTAAILAQNTDMQEADVVVEPTDEDTTRIFIQDESQQITAEELEEL